MNNNGTISIFQKVWDWFETKKAHSQIILMLFIIVGVLGWKVDAYQKEDNLKREQMQKELDACKGQGEELTELRLALQESNFKNILIKSSTDNAPNAQWFQDATTGNILWVNNAYERKYLYPLGLTYEHIVGTDGTQVFGNLAIQSKMNNRTVLREKKPIVFNEMVKTLKFEIKVGDFTYAIGAMEYQEF